MTRNKNNSWIGSTDLFLSSSIGRRSGRAGLKALVGITAVCLLLICFGRLTGCGETGSTKVGNADVGSVNVSSELVSEVEKALRSYVYDDEFSEILKIYDKTHFLDQFKQEMLYINNNPHIIILTFARMVFSEKGDTESADLYNGSLYNFKRLGISEHVPKKILKNIANEDFKRRLEAEVIRYSLGEGPYAAIDAAPLNQLPWKPAEDYETFESLIKDQRYAIRSKLIREKRKFFKSMILNDEIKKLVDARVDEIFKAVSIDIACELMK